jgi:hypothetical protein
MAPLIIPPVHPTRLHQQQQQHQRLVQRRITRALQPQTVDANRLFPVLFFKHTASNQPTTWRHRRLPPAMPPARRQRCSSAASDAGFGTYLPYDDVVHFTDAARRPWCRGPFVLSPPCKTCGRMNRTSSTAFGVRMKVNRRLAHISNRVILDSRSSRKCIGRWLLSRMSYCRDSVNSQRQNGAGAFVHPIWRVIGEMECRSCCGALQFVQKSPRPAQFRTPLALDVYLLASWTCRHALQAIVRESLRFGDVTTNEDEPTIDTLPQNISRPTTVVGPFHAKTERRTSSRTSRHLPSSRHFNRSMHGNNTRQYLFMLCDVSLEFWINGVSGFPWPSPLHPKPPPHLCPFG